MSQRRSLVIEIVRYVTPILILLLGIGGFFLMSALRKTPERLDEEKPQAPAVEVAKISPHADGITIELSGLVVPFAEHQVPAEVLGRVVKKHDICRAGRYVKKGTKLLEIDRQDFEIAEAEAEGALAELDAEMDSTRALLEIAKDQLTVEQREYDREKGLKGVASRADLDRAEKELLTAKNATVSLSTQLTSMEKREQRLQASLRRAKLDLDRTVVSAPVSGVIVRDEVQQDSFVQRGATLVVIEDTSKAEIKCSLRKDDLHWLWLAYPKPEMPEIQPVGDSKEDADSAAKEAEERAKALDYEIPQAEADVFYELVGNRFQWKGQLSRYDGIGLDSQTRTIPCRVLIDHPRDVTSVDSNASDAVGPRALLRGMYVTIEIKAKPNTPLYRIPQRAVRPGKVVWLVRDDAKSRDRKLVKQPVRIAETLSDEVIVHTNGTNIGGSDRIVISPLSYPRNGSPVREFGQPPGNRLAKKGVDK